MPSPVMASEENAAGAVLVASRQRRVANRYAGSLSSVTRQEMVTFSVAFGTAGECATSRMIGGTLLVSTEFGAMGVAPIAAVEGSQFWPLSLLITGLRSSMLRLPPSAGLCQSQ